MPPDRPDPEPEADADPGPAPLIGGLDIEAVTLGILRDLDLLRAGQITVPDARARAELARQALRAINFALQAHRMLAGAAKDVTALPPPPA